jgi:hypothetical protein
VGQRQRAALYYPIAAPVCLFVFAGEPSLFHASEKLVVIFLA